LAFLAFSKAGVNADVVSSSPTQAAARYPVVGKYKPGVLISVSSPHLVVSLAQLAVFRSVFSSAVLVACWPSFCFSPWCGILQDQKDLALIGDMAPEDRVTSFGMQVLVLGILCSCALSCPASALSNTLTTAFSANPAKPFASDPCQF
jgi:hypothetical protein